jgi:uncharacterized protein YjbI with pentapeptide repeats
MILSLVLIRIKLALINKVKLMTTEEIETLFKKEIITGKLTFSSSDEILMDRDFEDKTFRDLSITGSDFCSSSFTKCKFENVTIKNTPLVGVNFDNCTFSQCEFINIQLGFSMKNCIINSLTISRKA